MAAFIPAGVFLLFALSPEAVFGWPSKLVLAAVGVIILANGVAVFFEEGLHWSLSDDPNRYQLLYDLGLRTAPPARP